MSYPSRAGIYIRLEGGPDHASQSVGRLRYFHITRSRQKTAYQRATIFQRLILQFFSEPQWPAVTELIDPKEPYSDEQWQMLFEHAEIINQDELCRNIRRFIAQALTTAYSVLID